jgi:N-acetyl-gamma-glutamyl-phosphate reductase
MTKEKVKIGIVGASGYTGQELLRLLLQHPNARIEMLSSQSYAGKPVASVFPGFTGFVDASFCSDKQVDEMATNCDVVFFALPHGLAADSVDDRFLKRVKVVDLSADFRLKQASQYDTWYGAPHARPEMLPEAVYGLPEWRRKEIASARLVANPGCYATCTILSLLPLAAEGIVNDSIIVDAKSGVSGAGRSLSIDTHFNECNESLKAYKVATHRHTPEIEQELSAVAGKDVQVVFTPHLIPIDRGILTTSYCRLHRSMSAADLIDIYRKRYSGEPFVKVLSDAVPETRWTRGSNCCHIGVAVDARTNHAIVIASIDNLLKGAAGQAVQNMNLMFGLPETAGLMQPALVP